MGTNYYAEFDDGNRIHLGKNSSGWRFTIKENRDYYRTAQDLFEMVLRPDVTVENEYGEEVNSNYFIGKVRTNSNSGKIPKGSESYSLNGFFFKAVEFS